MDSKAFGGFIQIRRKELGMNQTQLAEKLHVTAKAVSRWERGVGFPSIELLQPLADALEITIAELMQSNLLDKDLPKEEAAQLVTQTVETIRQQEALTWKRKLSLYSGYGVLFFMYAFLYLVGHELESKWKGGVVVLIGYTVWYFGKRALYCLITGETYFLPRKKMSWKYHAAMAIFLSGLCILLVALAWVSNKILRDFVAIMGLMMAFASGCYLTIFEDELNK